MMFGYANSPAYSPCGPLDPAVPVPQTNLAAEYRFDEGTGSTLTDHGPNGHDGTITTATWSDFGLDFASGSAARVVLPADIFAFNTFTVCAAVTKSGPIPAGGQVLLERVDNFSFFVASPTFHHIYANFQDGGASITTLTATLDDMVRFLAFTFDGTALDTYYGGDSVTDAKTRSSLPSAAGAVTIGNSSSFSNAWGGSIGYLTVHEGPLSGNNLANVRAAMRASILARRGFA